MSHPFLAGWRVVAAVLGMKPPTAVLLGWVLAAVVVVTTAQQIFVG